MMHDGPYLRSIFSFFSRRLTALALQLAALALALAMATGGGSAQAGELYPDFDAGLVNFCPAEGEVFNEFAAEYLTYNIYEFDKILRRDPDYSFVTDGEEGDRRAVFSPARQESVRGTIDSAMYFASLIFPRLEPPGRIGGHSPATLSVRPSAPNGKVKNERLKIGFANTLIGGWVTMETDPAMTGVAIYHVLEALREADRIAPKATEFPVTNTLQSMELLVALERLDAAYTDLRGPMIGLIEWPGFGPALEMQTWAACSQPLEVTDDKN